MGSKLPPDKMELYRWVDEVLFYIWDPIGVRNMPETRDEYQSYVPQVFALVLKREETPIREYLLDLATNRMELPSGSYVHECTDRAIRFLLHRRKLLAVLQT